MNLIAMNCPQCGAKLEKAKDMMFCPYCGSKITIVNQGGTAPENDLQLGLSYLLIWEEKQADGCFKRLLEKVPTSNQAWFWRGIIALRQVDAWAATRYWQQSALNNDDAIALMVQVFSKPNSYLWHLIMVSAPSLVSVPGGWDLFTVIMQAGIKLGMQDLVAHQYIYVASLFEEVQPQIYDYVIGLDVNYKDGVIDGCLSQANYVLSSYNLNIAKAQSLIDYVKKIESDKSRLDKDFISKDPKLLKLREYIFTNKLNF